MRCIKNCWDQTDHTGVYSCPQCRETFTPRPVLGRNIMLTEDVGESKKRRLNPPPAQSYAGPGDVPCDFCTERKFKAVKSCLTCLVSYCETHVKPHYEGAAFKRHKLINAIGNLEQKLCAEHQKVLEGFCRTDQTCICWLCADKEHKSHDTVSAEAERTGKQVIPASVPAVPSVTLVPQSLNTSVLQPLVLNAPCISALVALGALTSHSLGVSDLCLDAFYIGALEPPSVSGRSVPRCFRASLGEWTLRASVLRLSTSRDVQIPPLDVLWEDAPSTRQTPSLCTVPGQAARLLRLGGQDVLHNVHSVPTTDPA
ncbi:UNVERIFIED_CONTAM: hypothetical protein FKN15_056289 [Acipenser sinensis]